MKKKTDKLIGKRLLALAKAGEQEARMRARERERIRQRVDAELRASR